MDSAHVYYKVSLLERLSSCVNSNGTVHVSEENKMALAAMSLDLEQMVAIEKRFGPVDWRIAETHALYWSSLGLACASGTERALCERAVNQALMMSVFRGSFAGSAAAKRWQAGPNLALATGTADGLIASLKTNSSPHQELIVVRFLETVLRLAVKEGQPELAQALYERLLRLVKSPQKPPTLDEVVKGWDTR
jgi:hypothetical protein